MSDWGNLVICDTISPPVPSTPTPTPPTFSLCSESRIVSAKSSVTIIVPFTFTLIIRNGARSENDKFSDYLAKIK